MSLSRRNILIGSSAMLAAAACQSELAIETSWSVVTDSVRKLIANKLSPGLSISVMKDGEFVYSKAFGLSNLENSSIMTTDSIFKIASITKQMVSAAVLLLQEAGKLSLEDSLSKYIPEFPRSNEFTLYQLATHTAGLGSFNRLESRETDRLREYDDDEYLDLMERTDPLFVNEPGVAERYSNTGYGLLGIVIGRVSGMHYSEFLKSRIFDVIGLSNTQVDNAYEVLPNRVMGYSPLSAAQSGFERGGYTSVSYPGPSGSVRSTSEDLCHWHKALVFGKFLKAESLAQMLASVKLPSETSYYGMGVQTKFHRDPFKDRNVVSHGGRIFGFAADLWSFPEKSVTVATLMNSDGGDNDDFGKRFDSVRDPATQIALGEYKTT